MPPFEKGHSGNPAGRPPGARNKTTVAMEELLDGEAELIIRKAIAKAKAGEVTALRACFDRIVPARRGRPAPFPLPSLNSAADAAKASAAIVEAVAVGDLTPNEAAALARVLDVFTRSRSAAELEERVTNLERMVNV
jgi:hypothetical protein